MRYLLRNSSITYYSKVGLQKKCDLFALSYSSLRPSTVKDNMDTLPYTGMRPDPIIVKPKRDPFLKNVLVGKFDSEMLVYPELLDLERLKNIDHLSAILNNFWREDILPNPKYFERGVTPDYITKIQNLGLFKQKVPYMYNGLELTVTESAKVVESVARHIVPANLLINQILVQEIFSMATEELKSKYYEHIVQSSAKGAICLSESHAEFDIRKSQTQLVWDDSEKSYKLTGQKVWVPLADTCDFFIVFAKHFDHKLENAPISTLVVDKNSKGVSINKHLQDGYFIVEFEDVIVPNSNVINKDKGFDIIAKIQSLTNLYSASALSGIVKDVYDACTLFLMYRPFLDKYSFDSEGTQVLMATLATDIYALESMIYFVANLLDGYENQDCEVELAALKLCASQVSKSVITECMNLLGPHVTMSSYKYPFLEMFKHCLQLSQVNISDDLVKLFIAVKCIEHNKDSMREYIKKIRNPYFHPNEALKHTVYSLNNERDDPKLNLELKQYVHPSLSNCADKLEYCVKRLEYANIKALEIYGAETYDHHYTLMRLANIITDIFATTCVLSRASRSYCTGIQNCDFEFRATELYAFSAQRNVRKNVNEILDGPQGHLDYVSTKIASKILDAKGYFAQHPLARNII